MAEKKELKQAQAAFNTLCKALDSDGWNYEKNPDDLTIDCGAKGDDIPIPIRIRVNSETAIIGLISQLPFQVPEKRRREMAVAVSQANNGMVDGSFDYDFIGGNIIFRLTVNIRDSLISENALKYMIYCACQTVDNYNDKFLMVAKNEMTCDEVAKFIE